MRLWRTNSTTEGQDIKPTKKKKKKKTKKKKKQQQEEEEDGKRQHMQTYSDDPGQT